MHCAAVLQLNHLLEENSSNQHDTRNKQEECYPNTDLSSGWIFTEYYLVPRLISVYIPVRGQGILPEGRRSQKKQDGWMQNFQFYLDTFFSKFITF